MAALPTPGNFINESGVEGSVSWLTYFASSRQNTANPGYVTRARVGCYSTAGGDTSELKPVGSVAGLGANFQYHHTADFRDSQTLFSLDGGAVVYARILTSAPNGSTVDGFGYEFGADNRILAHVPYSDGTIYWDFGDATPGSGRVFVAGETFEVGKLDVFVFSAGKLRGREIWRNGVRIAADEAATVSRPTPVGPQFYWNTRGTLGGYDAIYPIAATLFSEPPAGLCKRLSLDPWAVLFSEPRSSWISDASLQYSYPESDHTDGLWLPSSGSDLYAMLDENPASDSDYIYTNSPSTFRVKLQSIASPGVGDVTVSYRVWSLGTNNITIRLIEGSSTVIASWSHNGLSSTPTLFNQVLSSGEKSSVGDWANLYLEGTAS